MSRVAQPRVHFTREACRAEAREVDEGDSDASSVEAEVERVELLRVIRPQRRREAVDGEESEEEPTCWIMASSARQVGAQRGCR